MAGTDSTAETVLVVDDEATVRQTFLGWLSEAGLGVNLLSAGDAASALKLADQQVIDLAILDWNLGTGMDGLRLLEDLALFNPDIAAILVTGYAHRATPLMAMRLGVRDYLDKNQDLSRDTFLAAVRRQLSRIRPARRERRIQAGLAAFSEAVEKALPTVQAAARLDDPVPLGEGIRALARLACAVTGAADAVLVARSYDESQHPAERLAAYRLDGKPLSGEMAPFSSSLAAAALSMQRACIPGDSLSGVELHSWERGRKSLLLAPMDIAPGVQAVLELFDRPGGFTAAEERLAGEVAAMGEALLRQSLAGRKVNQSLAHALEAAARLRDGVAAPTLASGTALAPDATMKLAEAIRSLAARHGEPALAHCLRLVEGVSELLDAITGEGS
jgi:DNA-binding NarL/FixJ family response regulator